MVDVFKAADTEFRHSIAIHLLPEVSAGDNTHGAPLPLQAVNHPIRIMERYSLANNTSKLMWAISLLAVFLMAVDTPSFAEDKLAAQLSGSDWVYVVVMLEHSNWPSDVEEQKRLSRNIQDQALNGPLAHGFKLDHRFETVPALSGWINQSGYSDVQNASASGEVDIIQSIDPDVSGAAQPLISVDSGGGGLLDSVPLIRADKVHELGITGRNVEVAVLDTGIDSDHPDLVDSLVSEQCFCSTSTSGCCPDGTSVQSGAGSAEDDHGHGSHVAGIITSNGTISSVGVAPDSLITMIKILDSSNRFYSTSQIVAALDWLNVNRPDLSVVNMSLYTNATFTGVCDNAYAWTRALYLAVQNLVAKDVLVVAIAGNNSTAGIITAPGCLSNVIAAGASDKNDIPAAFSNSHPEVDYFAPGVNIVSADLGGEISGWSGTSFASPHVAATGALIRQAYPGTTNSEIIQVLTATGVPITDWNGLTRPRINAYDALSAVRALFARKTIPVIINILLNDD